MQPKGEEMNSKRKKYQEKLKKRILLENGYYEKRDMNENDFKNLRRTGRHVGFIGYYYDKRTGRLKYSSMKLGKKRLKRLAAKRYRQEKFDLEATGGKSQIRRKHFGLYWELY